MVNGVGLCLLSRRKKTGLIAVPFVGLSSSIIMIFSSLIIERFYKDHKNEWLVPIGSGAAAAGWLCMLMC